MKIDENQPIGEDIDKKEEEIKGQSPDENGGGEGKAPDGREYKIDASYYFADEDWFSGGSSLNERENKEDEKPSANYFGDEPSSAERGVNDGFFGEQRTDGKEQAKSPNYFGEDIHPIYREEGDGNGTDKNKGLGIASMILGIASIVGCCLEGMAIVPAVLAIVFASIRMKTKSDGCAVAGLITGIIGIVLNVVMIFILVFAMVEGMNPDYTETESAYELITRLLT